ncbi:S1-C subfamily serine protease [Sedimentibacter acidaminivorans]|jgi:S1-C subfamily serine protease|uniref:S1-C subfamily serine protease n=1 Tax=Sedimentibacter acidaminivorans TaxID=913099 RepID=A0ABS4GF67_9FIRM|nr:trypsin-like peptidase domain-containing protein [Sedimentibacter acidaminivorans]MBP1926338.1 S1-C subfamily serine protease [Sedimentibacter acidaminivorans]
MDDNERNIFNQNEQEDSFEKIEEKIYQSEQLEQSEKTNSTGYNNFSNEVNFLIRDDNQYSKKEKQKKPHKIKKRVVASFVLVALISSLLGGVAGGVLVNYQINNSGSNQTGNGKNTSAQQVNINLSDNMYFAAAVAEKAQKSVVGITTDMTQTINTFFGPQTQKGTSMGSGMIVDPNGYILTNAHVIGDGEYDKITVSLIDGSTIEGKVLWYDATLDLAVVKVDKTGLPAVELGDSDELMVGEPAVAIGNPMTLDLERTVTQGVISGLNRSIKFENGTTIKPLIQTDASINSGNSGGPLFNAEGQVIGINTAKMSTAEGLGFAIPINTAKSILEQIIGNGTVSSLYVGIKGVDVTTYEKSLGVDVSAEYGVVVIEAIKDSPAIQAGLEMGDVITAIDGNKIETMADLKRQLYQYKENDVVKVTINRGGDENTIDMKLKQKPANY